MPQRQKLRSRVSSQGLARWGTRLVLLVLLVVAGGLMVGFVRMTWTRHQLNQARAAQEAANQEQRARNAALRGEAEYRESDVYVEQAARSQLGMAREGETVLLPTVVIPVTPTPGPVAPSPAASAVAELAEAAPPPNYARWWQALFPDPATIP